MMYVPTRTMSCIALGTLGAVGTLGALFRVTECAKCTDCTECYVSIAQVGASKTQTDQEILLRTDAA